MGNLVSVVIFDGMTNLQETISEESKLRAMDIIEEEVGGWGLSEWLPVHASGASVVSHD
jgi:hypothetical protein